MYESQGQLKTKHADYEHKPASIRQQDTWGNKLLAGQSMDNLSWQYIIMRNNQYMQNTYKYCVPTFKPVKSAAV